MYGFESMIDMGLDLGGEWTTPDHRIVAVNACICNPNVACMDDLMKNVEIINNIPTEDIRTITLEGLLTLGCYL
jgi:hypothetical protein